MREQLLQRITPMIEKLAEQVVDLILERIDQQLYQLELAFDVAASSFASDLSCTDGAARRNDVRDDINLNRSAAQPRSRSRSEARKQSQASASGSSGAGREEHDDAAASGSAPERAAGLRMSSNRALEQGQDLPSSTSSEQATNLGGEVADAAAKQTPPSTDVAPVSEVATSATHRRSSAPPASARSCGCAPRGRHRKDCSIASTAPASSGTLPTPAPATPGSSVPSLTSRSPARVPAAGVTHPPSSVLSSAPATSLSFPAARQAAVKAAVARRDARKLEREQRALSPVRARRGPARSPVEGAVQVEATLPNPIASFAFGGQES